MGDSHEKLRADVLTLRNHYMKVARSNPDAAVEAADVSAGLSKILRNDDERRNDGTEMGTS